MVEYVYYFSVIYENTYYWMHVESYTACQELMDIINMETKYMDPSPLGVACKELPMLSQAPMPPLRPQGM
mgnify:FL=1